MRDHSRLKRATVAVRERTLRPGNTTIGTVSTPKGYCSNYVIISVQSIVNHQNAIGKNNFKVGPI